VKYLKLLKQDMTGGWSSTPWPSEGEFGRKTEREPVCGATGIWLLNSTQQALDWLRNNRDKGYCNLVLVESGDPNPVVHADKVGVRSARVLRVVSFKPLADAYDAQCKTLDDAYYAQRKTLDDAYYAQYKTLADAYRAQRKPLDDAYDAQLRGIFDELLYAKS